MAMNIKTLDVKVTFKTENKAFGKLIEKKFQHTHQKTNQHLVPFFSIRTKDENQSRDYS